MGRDVQSRVGSEWGSTEERRGTAEENDGLHVDVVE